MATTEIQRRCPACGSNLSQEGGCEGLCQACLIQLALESPSMLEELERPSEEATLAYSREAFSPGQILGKRYRIRALLGRGGMGEVWRATDLKLRVDVALKALLPQLLESSRALETLRGEVRVAREVISPNVCRVFDLVELDGQELVSMEYIDGITLLEIMRVRAPLQLSEAREIASQFLAGLQAIHDAGLVHRDIKPENLMMTRSGRVVLMDFGIAKGLADAGAGTVSGTPAYMAPEQARGEALDARADVFSAGVVLTEMIDPSGVGTHRARQKIWDGVHGEPPEIFESPWSLLLKTAVARQREQRPASASTLARALEEVTLRVDEGEGLEPYPGLAAFTEVDAEYFFGRELEVEALWRKLQRPHLLGLIGPSGAGKSSFLRAGLLPVIPTGWRAVITAPGSRPITALGQALADELSGDQEAVRDLLRFEEMDVAVSLVSRWRQRHDQALLIVDQFEELFTQNSPETQKRFTELLGRLALEADVHVLLSMRDDFLGFCSQHESLAPIFSELTPLKPLTGGAVRRALVQPALKCGYKFEADALVDEMVLEVSDERGALPLLAFAASRLWDHRDRKLGLLTHEAYEHIGGVGGALAQHAEATLEKIGEDRVPVVRELFRNLVTAQGTRAARDREELLSVFGGESFADVGAGDRTAAEDVLNTLIDARLLTSYEVPAADETETAQHRIEIIHESLLSNWPRLVRWQTQDADSAQLRDQIRQAAQMWEERGRPEDLLWTGTSFGEYQLWKDRYEGGLSTAEESFGDAMVHKAERQKRRWRMVVTGAFGVLLVVVTVIAWFGWQANVEHRRAEAETLRAEAGKLIALGEVEIDTYPTAALAWATKSLELADTSEGRLLALRALQQGPPATALPEAAWRLALSSSGEWLGTSNSNHVAVRPRDGRPLIPLDPLAGPSPAFFMPARMAFSGNDTLVTDHKGYLQWWSVPGGDEIRRAEDDRGRIHLPGEEGYLSFSREGEVDSIDWWPFEEGTSRFVGAMEAVFTEVREGRPNYQAYSSVDTDPTQSWLAYFRDKAVFVRSLEDWSRPPIHVGDHDAGVVGIAIHPDGSTIAAIDESAKIHVWQTAEPSATPLRVIQADADYLIQFDPSGRWLIGHDVVDGSPTVGLWDLTAPQGTDPLTLQRGDRIWLHQVVIDPNSHWLVTAHGDDATFWPLTGGNAKVFRGHRELVRAVGFTPNGDWLISVAQDGVRAWPLRGQDNGESRLLVDREMGIWPRLDIHPSGRMIAVGLEGGVALVVPVDGGEIKQFGVEEAAMISNLVALSPSGRLLATVSLEGASMTVRIWSLGSGEVRDVGLVSGESNHLRFVDEGHLIWTGSPDSLNGQGGGEWFFDLELGEARKLEREGREMVRAVSGSGTFVISVDYEGERTQLFWRSLVGGESRRVPTHGDHVTGVAISPSNQWMVTGDYLGVVRVGRVTGEEPHQLVGHRGSVLGLAVSPDGRWIASGGDDGTVRLWPTPDLNRPPLHTLPHDELMAKLKSLTNARIFEDAESSSGWKLDYGPFPGWQEVPEW